MQADWIAQTRRADRTAAIILGILIQSTASIETMRKMPRSTGSEMVVVKAPVRSRMYRTRRIGLAA